jgi:hypothetical protein
MKARLQAQNRVLLHLQVDGEGGPMRHDALALEHIVQAAERLIDDGRGHAAMGDAGVAAHVRAERD